MKGSFPGRLVRAAIADLEADLDRIADTLAEGEGLEKRVRLLAYAGYRTPKSMRLRGRVVRFAPGLSKARGTGFFRRLRAMMAIYNSDELPGVAVRVTGYGLSCDVMTDEEGYFTFDLPVPQPLPLKTAWEQVTLETPGREAQQPSVSVPILAPGTDRNWGIISDIDDTVVETGATNFLKNWRRVLVEGPSDRIAVPGASTLYNTIAGDHRAPARPIFYVSSSPWNLYGFITEFMELNHIPHGPMFLKDYGIDRNKLIDRGHDEHKLEAIETILSAFPDLRFLLIGDNGQRDVSIYAQVVRDFGTRVAGVFIRDVDGSCSAGPEGALLAEIEATGTPTFCGATFDDAVQVAQALDLDRPLEAASAIVEPAELDATPAPPPA
jgi:phosphatidate phosphatase APP1